MDTENVSLTIEGKRKIELAHFPVTQPATPPGMAPGIEYLSGSPFQGTKHMTKETDGDPYVIDVTIPMRKLDSKWHGVIDPNAYKLKAPSKISILVEKDSRTGETVTDATTRWWEMEEHDVPGDAASSWPDMQSGVEWGYPYGVVDISLDTLINESLETSLWTLSNGSMYPYPGLFTWALNRVSRGMDIPATDEAKWMSGVAASIIFAPFKPNESASLNIVPVYRVFIYRAVIQYLPCTEPDGGTHWHPCPLAPYDIRSAFFAKINNPGDSKFFQKLSVCSGKSAISTILANIANNAVTDSESEVALTFYKDITEAAYADGTNLPNPEGTIPINGDRHMKIKLRHKDYVYDCNSSIYRSWLGSEN